VSIDPADAAALSQHGVEVNVLEKPPSLRQLAAAALELRKRHPALPLLVAASASLVRRLQQRYPPLVDVPLTSTTAPTVLAWLDPSR
jgi:hypothetical protein